MALAGLVGCCPKVYPPRVIPGATLPVTVYLGPDTLRLRTSIATLEAARRQADSTGKPVVVDSGRTKAKGNKASKSAKTTVLPSGDVVTECVTDSAAIRGTVKCPDVVVPPCSLPDRWEAARLNWSYWWLGVIGGVLLCLLAGFAIGWWLRSLAP